MLSQNFPKFDIRDHINNLISVKGQKGKYICPNPKCGSNNLSINLKTGAYDCYTCHNQPAIREALSPLAEKLKEFNEPKKIRPKQSTEWFYHITVDGNLSTKPLIKVTRTDDGNGKRNFSQSHLEGNKWASGYGEIKREQIALYKINEIKEAVSNGELIFLTEGEGCADRLWSLGLKSTSNIGGSGKWLNHHSEQLKGAKVCIVPDRDVPGLKHCERIAKDFPDAQWLYAFPDSKLWDNPPPDNGLDIVDWIDEMNLTQSDIIEKIEDKKREINLNKTSNIIDAKDKFISARWGESDIKEALIKISNQNHKDSDLKLKINDLSNKSLWNIKELYSVYNSLIKEQDLTEIVQEDVKQFKKLVSFESDVLHLQNILPEPLAKALNSKADSDRLDPMRMLQNILPAISTVLGSKLSIVAKEGFCNADSWVEYPVMWTVDISPPSSGKSNAQRAIWQPIKALQQKEVERYNQAMERLKEIEENWKNYSKAEKDAHKETEDNPLVFKKLHCNQKKWIFDVGQIEAVLRRLSEQLPTQGTTWLADELTGLIRGLDQYKAGSKGDSLQILLESWNGKITKTIDRVDSTNSFSLSGQTLNICGGIQPQKAQEIWQTQDDPDGFLSRMLPAISKIPEDFAVWNDKKVNIYGELIAFYEVLAQLPEIQMVMSAEAQKEWHKYWETLRRGYLQYETTNPAYAYFLGKQCSYVPRFALELHSADYAYGLTDNLAVCSLSAVKRAIALSKYYSQQFRLLQSDSKNQDSLDGMLLKVVQLLQSEGEITSRIISRKFSRYTYQGQKINASIAMEMMKTLSDNGYGILEGKKLILDKSVNVSTSVNTSVNASNGSYSKDSNHIVNLSTPPPPLEKVDEINTVSAIDKTNNIDNTNGDSGNSQNIPQRNLVKKNNLPIESVDSVDKLSKPLQSEVLTPLTNPLTNVDNVDTSVNSVNIEDEEDINDVAETLLIVDSKGGLKALREIYPPELFQKASRIVKSQNQNQYELIKQWVLELNDEKLPLFCGDKVEVTETSDKGRIGIVSKIRDEGGHTSYREDGEDKPYCFCTNEGFEWNLEVKFEDGSQEYFYPKQLRKIT